MLSVIVPTRQEGGVLLRGLAALATVPGVDEVVVAASSCGAAATGGRARDPSVAPGLLAST